MNPGNCRSCDRPVRWVTAAATGKTMPIDPAPAPNGNIIITAAGKAYVFATHADAVAMRDRSSDPYLRMSGTYISHFATCPAAAKHRRPAPEPIKDEAQGTLL